MSSPVPRLARRILPLVDLTELAATCQPADVTALCQKARQLPVAVAAVCVRPAFVALANAALAGSGIRVATVINFPTADVPLEDCSRNTDARAQAKATASAIAAGADEIDVVMAYGTFQAGEREAARVCLEAVKAACGAARLKVILESGAFSDLAQLRAAAELAVDAGADFLKTSTGFHAIGATPEATKILCEVSGAYAKQIGIKISGGLRNPEQAQAYLDLMADKMGLNWVVPENFRIGASKLVDVLLAPDAPALAAGY
jgi:deoxyribose-phosphate aldolase